MALGSGGIWHQVEVRKRYALLVSLSGIVLVALSTYAAFLYEFTHYYEPMLLGLILTLVPFTPSSLLNRRTVVPLYVVFVLAGVLFDGIIVPNVVELWSYGYESSIEYVPLYLWIYPAGGFVMLQSFIVLDRLLDNPDSATLPVIWPIGIAGVVAITGTIGAVVLKAHPIIVFGGLVVAGFFTREYIAQWRTGTSLLGKLYAAPLRVFGSMLVIAIINAILHEAPNTAASQWAYHDIPFAAVGVFEVPVVVIIGWIFLVAAPVSWYYSDPLDILRGSR